MITMETQVPAFVFVSEQGSGKPRKMDRKLIRSHVMRGKNMRKVVEQPDFQWMSHNNAISPSARPLLLSFPVSPTHEAQSSQSRGKQRRLLEQHREAVKAGVNTIPSPSPTPPPPVHFADELDSESLQILFNVLPSALRAVSLADLGLPLDLKSSQWQDWLFSDVAYVHAAIVVSSVIQDFVLQRKPSKATTLHLHKAVSQLNKNLSQEAVSLSDSTIGVVISLSLASLISTDYNAISAHAAGLRQMVRLRGGLNSFRNNPQLQVGISRIDLCLSLSTGQSPIFTTSQPLSSSEPNSIQLDYRDQESDFPEVNQFIDSLVDCRIAAIFRDLRLLSQRVNRATSGQQVMQVSYVHAGLYKIQYQLFELQDKLNDIISECLRMAMLAFLTTTFQVLGSRIKYKHITNRLRELCQAVEAVTEPLQAVMFWILMVGTIALFDTDEVWLREKWQEVVCPLSRGQQWVDARRRMQGFVWIDVCNDKAAKRVFEELSSACYPKEEIKVIIK